MCFLTCAELSSLKELETLDLSSCGLQSITYHEQPYALKSRFEFLLIEEWKTVAKGDDLGGRQSNGDTVGRRRRKSGAQNDGDGDVIGRRRRRNGGWNDGDGDAFGRQRRRTMAETMGMEHLIVAIPPYNVSHQ
ncbi:hypothetical protein E3N88_23029 [Mikania micrantha]|uniref:Uncharacterized protein n=1 Tax=Mikania micrantha TaxID=192012 RepID=A0A5N6NEM3_9ASTR|nr:hypothetical protein E3N88_23029 [Mikania micrantha]